MGKIKKDDVVWSEWMRPYHMVIGEGLPAEVAFKLSCEWQERASHTNILGWRGMQQSIPSWGYLNPYAGKKGIKGDEGMKGEG